MREYVAVQEVADWLEKLGMTEYAQRFAENKIDLAALRYLTDQDLKDIGVALGDRRKMLAAIAKLTSQHPAPMESKRQDTAERRQITVMFSDLVGSTALSARMDVLRLSAKKRAAAICGPVRGHLRAVGLPTQHVRQLGYFGRDAPGLVTGEHVPPPIVVRRLRLLTSAAMNFKGF